jgi:hypothetical protein
LLTGDLSRPQAIRNQSFASLFDSRSFRRKSCDDELDNKRARGADLTKVSVKAIRLDFQPPENLLEDTVNGYVEMLQRGEELPPIRLRFDGADYLLEDGFHRVEAAKRVGVEEIEAEVLPGTFADMEANFREYLKALKSSLSE